MADEINQSEHVKVLKLNAVVLTLAVFLNHQEKKFRLPRLRPHPGMMRPGIDSFKNYPSATYVCCRTLGLDFEEHCFKRSSVWFYIRYCTIGNGKEHKTRSHHSLQGIKTSHH